MAVGGWQGLAGALLLFGTLVLAPAASAQEARSRADGPDFSDITTRAAANRLVRAGRLVRSRALPVALAGTARARGILYLPPAVEDARQLLVATLRRFTEEDLVDSLDVQAEYRGASIVPARIRFVAAHSRGGKPFEGVLEVW